MEVYAVLDGPLAAYDDWQAKRRLGLGATDAGPVCGVSPWRTAFEVYLDKIGELPDREPTAAMEWGTRLEPVVAAAYAERRGVELSKPPMRWHPDYPWMFANIDRESEDRRIVELKTASAWVADEWGDDGTDQAPEGYVLQVSHQMAVANIDLADIAVLIGGSDFRVFHIERNRQLETRLIEIESAFWECVQRREPPEPTWSHPSTVELMKHLYGVDELRTVNLDGDAMDVVERWENARNKAKTASELAGTEKARLQYLLGDASEGRLPDGRMIRRKNINRRGYTVEPATYIDMRILGGQRR